MNRSIAMVLIAALIIGTAASSARAAVNVERQGSENALREVAMSTVWGGLGGLVLGGAIALLNTDNDNNGDIVRWSFVGGTFLGLGYGIYHVSTRPQVTALLEFQDGALSLHAAPPTPEPGRGVAIHLVAVRF